MKISIQQVNRTRDLLKTAGDALEAITEETLNLAEPVREAVYRARDKVGTAEWQLNEQLALPINRE